MGQSSALAHLLATKRGAIAQADLFISEAGHFDQDALWTRAASTYQRDALP